MEEEEREKGEEDKCNISYNYEELKSSPEVVNMSPDTYLELQYPPHTALHVTHSPCHTLTRPHTHMVV